MFGTKLDILYRKDTDDRRQIAIQLSRYEPINDTDTDADAAVPGSITTIAMQNSVWILTQSVIDPEGRGREKARFHSSQYLHVTACLSVCLIVLQWPVEIEPLESNAYDLWYKNEGWNGCGENAHVTYHYWKKSLNTFQYVSTQGQF